MKSKKKNSNNKVQVETSLKKSWKLKEKEKEKKRKLFAKLDGICKATSFRSSLFFFARWMSVLWFASVFLRTRGAAVDCCCWFEEAFAGWRRVGREEVWKRKEKEKKKNFDVIRWPRFLQAGFFPNRSFFFFPLLFDSDQMICGDAFLLWLPSVELKRGKRSLSEETLQRKKWNLSFSFFLFSFSFFFFSSFFFDSDLWRRFLFCVVLSRIESWKRSLGSQWRSPAGKKKKRGDFDFRCFWFFVFRVNAYLEERNGAVDVISSSHLADGVHAQLRGAKIWVEEEIKRKSATSSFFAISRHSPTVRMPSPEATMGPMVLPQAVSFLTMTSWIGMFLLLAISLITKAVDELVAYLWLELYLMTTPWLSSGLCLASCFSLWGGQYCSFRKNNSAERKTKKITSSWDGFRGPDQRSQQSSCWWLPQRRSRESIFDEKGGDLHIRGFFHCLNRAARLSNLVVRTRRKSPESGLKHEGPSSVGAVTSHLLVVKEGNEANVGVLVQGAVFAAPNESLQGTVGALEVVKPGREDKFLQRSTNNCRLSVRNTKLKVTDLRN